MEIVDLKIDVLTDIDPDEGLEWRPESLDELLQAAKEAKAAGQSTIPDDQIAELEEIVKEHGLA